MQSFIFEVNLNLITWTWNCLTIYIYIYIYIEQLLKHVWVLSLKVPNLVLQLLACGIQFWVCKDKQTMHFFPVNLMLSSGWAVIASKDYQCIVESIWWWLWSFIVWRRLLLSMSFWWFLLIIFNPNNILLLWWLVRLVLGEVTNGCPSSVVCDNQHACTQVAASSL